MWNRTGGKHRLYKFCRVRIYTFLSRRKIESRRRGGEEEEKAREGNNAERETKGRWQRVEQVLNWNRERLCEARWILFYPRGACCAIQSASLNDEEPTERKRISPWPWKLCNWRHYCCSRVLSLESSLKKKEKKNKTNVTRRFKQIFRSVLIGRKFENFESLTCFYANCKSKLLNYKFISSWEFSFECSRRHNVIIINCSAYRHAYLEKVRNNNLTSHSCQSKKNSFRSFRRCFSVNWPLNDKRTFQKSKRQKKRNEGTCTHTHTHVHSREEGRM